MKKRLAIRKMRSMRWSTRNAVLQSFVQILAVGLTSSCFAAGLLIKGGTLIDGTGGAPIANARILTDGNIIQRVWSGDNPAQQIPADTQVVDADGMYIIPGLIDSHVHYRPYMGELFLAHGVTTVYDLGDPQPWQLAVKKGLNSGMIRGPRFYFCGQLSFADGRVERGLPKVDLTAVEPPLKTPSDAKRAVAALKEYSDCIKLDENVKGDFFTAIAREAKPAGMAIISHSLNATDSASWGINGIEHMPGVAVATIRSEAGRQAVAAMKIEAGHKNSELYRWMEPEHFDEVIDDLVRRKIFINPTLDFEWKGLMERVHEFELEDTKLLNNPDLQYVPLDERLVTLGQYHWADGRTAEEKRRYLDGYRKVQEFLGRFVKAGGKIYVGTDSAAATTPGLAVHHEMQLFADAHLSPMQALMTATKWGAEIIGLDKQLGTIEPKKLADIVILRKDPLADIANSKEIERVIQNGKIVDTSYHSSYQFPYRHPGPESKHLYNPSPEISDIEPPSVVGNNEVKLRIAGRGFVRSSVVLIDGTAVATRLVSPTSLEVTLSSTQTSHPGTLMVTVATPKPGGGSTEPLEFFVTFP